MTYYLTRQQAFDKAVTHLLSMDEQAVGADLSGNIVCVYRGGSGRRCPIGALIPDDKYRPKMESLGAGAVMRQWPGVIPLRNTDYNFRLLDSIQGVHDDDDCWASRDEMLRQLRELAKENNLKTTVIER